MRVLRGPQAKGKRGLIAAYIDIPLHKPAANATVHSFIRAFGISTASSKQFSHNEFGILEWIFGMWQIMVLCNLLGQSSCREA